MWQSFKNYFVTAQLIAGGVLAANVAGAGWKEGGLWAAILWAVGAFLCAILITAPLSLARAVLHHRQMRLLQTSPDRPGSK